MLKSDSSEIIKRINDYLKNHRDERVKKIFELRYFSYKNNKIKPWRLIYKEIGLSIQGCINLHKKTIQEIRKVIGKDE
jgi:DNA-directed RNA polymerase specialized sigma subunit